VDTLWISAPQEGDPTSRLIYDVAIEELRRGTGYGRCAMEAAEQLVHDGGGRRLALSVFGPNKVARQLYESMGCEVAALSMFNEL